MTGVVERMAMVAMHTSPAEQAGTADAGGLNVSVLATAAELSIRGIEVDLITRALGEPSVRDLMPGVRLVTLAAGGPGAIQRAKLPEHTDEFGEALATVARGGDGRYDLIHAHYWLSGIAALPVCIELGIPLVQSFHTLAAMKNAATIPGVEPEPLVRSRSETFLANQADAIVAASSAEAASIIDDVNGQADRTWIVPPGVDLGLFSPRDAASATRVRAALALDPDRPLVVLAGRAQPLKGHELAIRSIAELRAMRGWAPLLVIVGETTPGDEGFSGELHELAASLGVAGDVQFVGAVYHDRLAELLSAAHLTIVPSFTETFGLIAIESAASGTPVIGYRTGGLSESIGEGVSGLLLGSRDPRYWATEIANLIENDERRDALGLTARAFAERFSWGSAAASLLGIYAGVGRP